MEDAETKNLIERRILIFITLTLLRREVGKEVHFSRSFLIF